MRYCPNPGCPFLDEFGMIAEYNHTVTHCVDCGTALEIGEAPTPKQLKQYSSSVRKIGEADLATLAVFGEAVDAEMIRTRLLARNIPAFIIDMSPADEDWDTWNEAGDVIGKRVLIPPEFIGPATLLLGTTLDEEEDS